MSLKKVKYNRDGEWKYVCRELREIKGVVYVFNFFYCEGNNEIQVKFYNLADGTEAIDVIVLDVDLKFKTRHEICEIIKYDIAYRISVWEDTIQLHSWSDEILSDGNILSSLRKLQAFFLRVLRRKRIRIAIHVMHYDAGKVLLNFTKTIRKHDYIFVIYSFFDCFLEEKYRVVVFSRFFLLLGQRIFSSSDFAKVIMLDSSNFEQKLSLYDSLFYENNEIFLTCLNPPRNSIPELYASIYNTRIESNDLNIFCYSLESSLIIQCCPLFHTRTSFVSILDDFFTKNSLSPTDLTNYIQSCSSFTEFRGLIFDQDQHSISYNPQSTIRDFSERLSNPSAVSPHTNQPLLSRPLFKYISIYTIAAIKIQKTFRSYLLKQKLKLLYLKSFRKASFELINRSGKVINHTPYAIGVFKSTNAIFIKVRNLISENMHYCEIQPSDFIFGFIKMKSYRLICNALVIHNGVPSFEYCEKQGNIVNVSNKKFVEFKKYTEKMSLHTAVRRIQGIYRAIKLRKVFQLNNPKEIQHLKKTLGGIEYNVALFMRKHLVFIELYLLKKPKSGVWRYSASISNNKLIEQFGEITAGMILQEINLVNGLVVLGSQGNIETYQMQKHSSFIWNEKLTAEKILVTKTTKDFTITVLLRSFNNDYIGNTYDVIYFETYSNSIPHYYRSISVDLKLASANTGIPSLWAIPIANYMLLKCFIINKHTIKLDFANKKLDLNAIASRLQQKIRAFLTKSAKKRSISKKRISIRYRLNFVINKPLNK